jgi:gliding motility-associated-like protein
MNCALIKKNNSSLFFKATVKQFSLLLLICLCGFKGFSQPANDEPCNAITLTATATCTYQTFTNAAATATAGVPAPGCANYLGGDVWFQVTVPAGGSLHFDTQTGVITDGGMAIYNAPSCTGPFTLIECDDDDSPNGAMSMINASGLTPGSTVWIRIWEYGNNNNGTFGICVTLPPPPPANDEPCTAIPVTANNNCTYTTYSNAGATGTTGVPAPGCANYNGGDVWFQVTVPCGGSLRFDTQTGTVTDGGMAIYSGTSCSGPLTLIECDDDDSPNGLMPQITSSTLVPGSTVWIRVWEYGNDNNGTFGLCVSVPPPPGPGGSCSSALPFCTSNVYTFPNNTNQPSLGGNGIYGCLFTTPNPVWYYMQVQNPGNITIGISQVSTTGTPLDVDFALWGPFASLAGSCGGLTAANNISCSYSSSATETAVINNAQAGQFYILLLTNFSNQPGTITFQQTGGTATSNCAIICSLTAANTGPVCGGGTFNLTSTAVANATYSWTGPNCFTSVAQNPTGVIAPTAPGTYIYTVTATTPSGSSCTATTTVTVNPKPDLGIDKTLTICSGTTANLTTQFTTTGTTTVWTVAGTPVTTPAAVNVSGIYQLIATNGSGCKDTALLTLVVDTVRAIVTPGAINCTNNGTITITNATGIGAFTYNISSSPGVFQAANVFSVPTAGPYTVITKDAQGCTNSQAVNVVFTPNLTLQVRLDTAICLGNSVRLNTISNATTYSWSPAAGLDNPNSASPLATPSVPTSYTLTATLGQCTLTRSVNVNVVQQVTVDAGTDVSIISGDQVQLNASATGANSFLWTPSAGLSSTTILNPVAKPAVTTTYTLTATNVNGCIATDNIVITVVPYCIKVKNAFTPNGDGINDLWQVYDQFDCLKNVSLHVFNRYGSKVFESQDYRNNWDGNYKGKPVPDATYYAVINFTLITGKVFTVRTDLTILR